MARAIIVAGVLSAVVACGPGDSTRQDLIGLQKEVDGLQTATKSLEESVSALRTELQSLASRDSTTPSACVDISADVYQELGKLWQVTALRLVSHPQGCELRGQVLSRLMVNRENVRFAAWLPGDASRADGVIRWVRAGRYSTFSVVIRTKVDLKEVSIVCLAINENTGTTSAVW